MLEIIKRNYIILVKLITIEYTFSLIFSYSPAAFDEQIAFTLRAYRDIEWEGLQKEQRPAYGKPGLEAETAQEVE